VVDFLSAQKGVRREANQDNNPAAWMLEVLAEDTGGDTDLADAFAASALARDGLAAAHAAAVGNGAAVNQGRDTPAPKNPAVAGDYAADWIAMLRMCSSRAMLSYWRNPGYARLVFVRVRACVRACVCVCFLYRPAGGVGRSETGGVSSGLSQCVCVCVCVCGRQVQCGAHRLLRGGRRHVR
jgi:hypothetical protein